MRYHQYPSNWNGPYKSVSPYASLMGLSDEDKAKIKRGVIQKRDEFITQKIGLASLGGLLTYGSYRIYTSKPETSFTKASGAIGGAASGIWVVYELYKAGKAANSDVDLIVNRISMLDPQLIEQWFKSLNLK